MHPRPASPRAVLAARAALVAALLAGGCSRDARPGADASPSPSPSASPAATAPPGPSPTPSAGPGTSPAPTQVVAIWLVVDGAAVPAADRFGCENGLVAAQGTQPAGLPPVEAAIRALLEDPTDNPQPAGPSNTFVKSDLTLESATVVDHTATIRLRGRLNPAGVCDHPRFEEQLERTAGSVPGVDDVEILVGGVPLDEVLSVQ